VSRTTIGTLLALLLTTVGFSGTAAAHSHRCKTGCMADLGHGVLEWLHYAIDFVAVGGLLG
jgi:hypothetical protein